MGCMAAPADYLRGRQAVAMRAAGIAHLGLHVLHKHEAKLQMKASLTCPHTFPMPYTLRRQARCHLMSSLKWPQEVRICYKPQFFHAAFCACCHASQPDFVCGMLDSLKFGICGSSFNRPCHLPLADIIGAAFPNSTTSQKVLGIDLMPHDNNVRGF